MVRAKVFLQARHMNHTARRDTGSKLWPAQVDARLSRFLAPAQEVCLLEKAHQMPLDALISTVLHTSMDLPLISAHATRRGLPMATNT